MFPERLLLWRPLRAAVGDCIPQAFPPMGHQYGLGMIPANAVQSLPIHPTQLYSAIDGLMLLLLLSAYFRSPPRRRGDGPLDGDVSRLAILDRILT